MIDNKYAYLICKDYLEYGVPNYTEKTDFVSICFDEENADKEVSRLTKSRPKDDRSNAYYYVECIDVII